MMSSIAKELYPDAFQNGCYDSPYDYTPIVEHFGAPVVRVDDNDYQGDSRVLYRDGNRYGYLQFGWGSCSGCDALQACGSYEDLDTLIENLRESVRWWESSEEAIAWLTKHDWNADYSWHADEQKKFVRESLTLLGYEDAEGFVSGIGRSSD